MPILPLAGDWSDARDRQAAGRGGDHAGVRTTGVRSGHRDGQPAGSFTGQADQQPLSGRPRPTRVHGDHRRRRVRTEELLGLFEARVYIELAVTQHTTAWCSVQVVDIILTEGPIREYYIRQSGTTET